MNAITKDGTVIMISEDGSGAGVGKSVMVIGGRTCVWRTRLLRNLYSIGVPYAPASITTALPGLRKYFVVGGPDRLFIQDGYQVRENNAFFDDTVHTDGWQREVYQFARRVLINNGSGLVCDLGCGSGYKLVKYFQDVRTIGVDLPQTCAYLRSTYPDREWREVDLNYTPDGAIDMIISADVIEHLPDPDEYLRYIARLAPRQIVLSTPDRNLMPRKSHGGPPANPHHVREWSFNEFRAYIGKHFKIERHFISNVEQGTQVILCRPA